MPTIDQFRGDHYFLSNFYNAPVQFEGQIYHSNEAAFQAAKLPRNDYTDTKTKLTRADFTRMNPALAKRNGRRVKLRSDWEDVKFDVMQQIVNDKFTRNPKLGAQLKQTGDTPLKEGNYWHDQVWGVDLKTGIGQNHLGRSLMQTRQQLLHQANGQTVQPTSQPSVKMRYVLVDPTTGQGYNAKRDANLNGLAQATTYVSPTLPFVSDYSQANWDYHADQMVVGIYRNDHNQVLATDRAWRINAHDQTLDPIAPNHVRLPNIEIHTGFSQKTQYQLQAVDKTQTAIVKKPAAIWQPLPKAKPLVSNDDLNDLNDASLKR